MTSSSFSRLAWSSKAGRGAAVAAFVLMSASAAMAQAVTLSCPTPTSTGVTANLSTAAGTWETSGDGGAWVSAAAYQHPAWTSTPPAIWIGAVTGASFTAVDYRVMVNAADPYIDLASATVTYNYRVDNTVSGVTFNSAALTSSPSTTFNSASPYSSASQSVPSLASVPSTSR